MQLTIDSSESLTKVATVVGALYGVELVVAESGSAGSAPEPTAEATGTGSVRRRQAAIAASKAARRSAGRGKRAGKRVDASVVRQWAVEQGLTVSNRGQLPKAVLSAYNEQHS